MLARAFLFFIAILFSSCEYNQSYNRSYVISKSHAETDSAEEITE